MELYQVTQVEDINVGDVVVANYSTHVYTALINDITAPTGVSEDDDTSWVFDCGPVTRIKTVDGKQVMENSEAMEFRFTPETDEVPQSVFVVR